jgi:SAM-dependent methyltransferase
VERAIANLRRCLAPGGRLIATVPVGYNPELDRLLGEGTLRPDHLGCLKRINRDNDWVEAGWKEVRGLKFADPLPFANAICVLTFGALPVG